jgi:hypothetical protein
MTIAVTSKHAIIREAAHTLNNDSFFAVLRIEKIARVFV